MKYVPKSFIHDKLTSVQVTAWHRKRPWPQLLTQPYNVDSHDAILSSQNHNELVNQIIRAFIH